MTEASEVESKALSPIVVTELGIVTEVSAAFIKKAKEPIVVTPGAIVTDPAHPSPSDNT